MSYYGMSFYDMQKIYVFNNLRRTKFINKALRLDSDIEKAKFVVDYFTNNLPKDVVADIDSVYEKDVVDFSYDYSFVRGNDTPFPRLQERIRYPQGFGTTMTCADVDVEVEGKPKIYPTVYALKQGTCVIFANEIMRIMSNLGIKCEIIETPECVDCYDRFGGTDVEFNKIDTNDIKKIRHYYNIIEIDNKKYKVDIAGYLTAQDFNKFKPEKYKENIDINRFCMTEDLYSNPFEEIKSRSMGD